MRPPTATLGPNRYGMSGIRLLLVARDPEQHHLSELEVSTTLAGDLEAAHTTGDNAGVLPTDSQRNAVYALARQYGVDPIEEFALRLGRHFLASSPAIEQATVAMVAHQWHPIPVAGRAHPHAFLRREGERRLARVRVDRHGQSVASGMDGVTALRTTGSSFTGFQRDEYTTLPEAEDRVLATSIQAHWHYLDGVAGDWDRYHTTARQSLLTAFADHNSQSLQHTLYRMGQQLLAECPEIAEVRLTLTDHHHLGVDLSPFGLTNDREVLAPQERPHGLVEGVVRRAGLSATADW